MVDCPGSGGDEPARLSRRPIVSSSARVTGHLPNVADGINRGKKAGYFPGYGLPKADGFSIAITGV
jgi:hypothetical protein